VDANKSNSFGSEPHPRLLMRISEAANCLAISRASLYQIIQRGELSVIKVGRSSRLRLSDLSAWVSARASKEENR
jgi:excisionase family DNA binding protein